jgi:hypothetical protein
MDKQGEILIVGPMQAIMSGVITIFFYAMVIAAVWKLFLMAGDLSEIKTILSDIRRNTASPAPADPVAAAPPMSLESAEALLREIAPEPLAEAPKTTV